MRKNGERFIFWLVVAILIAGSVYGIIRAVNPGENIPLPSELTENDWIQGNPDAKVVLIEYSDFQCPACVHAYKLTEEIMDEFGGHIKFAFRHFPLTTIHDKAQLAAQAAEAAGLQGKFWEMYEMLFDYQTTWDRLSVNDAENQFIGYASDIGLDQKQFIEDLHSKEVKEAVDIDFQSAIDGGLNATPTFFLNGEKITPRNIEEFRTLIRTAIEQNNT
jgi:protein-disulfide isomerase